MVVCGGTFFEAELVVARGLKVVEGDEELRVVVVGLGPEQVLARRPAVRRLGQRTRQRRERADADADAQLRRRRVQRRRLLQGGQRRERAGQRRQRPVLQQRLCKYRKPGKKNSVKTR